jgi:thiol-disulfide isomerase/thioredoxin
MKSKLKRYAKELAYFLIVMTVFANAISLYKSQSLNDAPLEMSSFELLGGDTRSLKQGKPTLIHFWATWCPTCKLEASNIEFLSHRYEVVTIAVNSGSDEEIQSFLNERGYTYSAVNDTNGRLASSFKIAAYPTTFIYDKNKKLVFSDVGYSSTFSLYLKMLWAGMK